MSPPTISTSTVACEALRLLGQMPCKSPLHQIHSDVLLPNEAVEWSLEQLAERVIQPMVWQLYSQISPDGVICGWPLEYLPYIPCAVEEWKGLSLRACTDYRIELDQHMLRIDIRFFSVMYQKKLQREHFWRKWKDRLFFWRRF